MKNRVKKKCFETSVNRCVSFAECVGDIEGLDFPESDVAANGLSVEEMIV